jgi:hypothetical protein
VLWLQTSLDRLREGGKANLGVSEIEYSVVVGHKGVAQDPELAADARVPDDAANAIVRACRGWTKVQALCHWEVLATDGEGNGGESGVARESVESWADGGGSILSTRDLLIERSNVGGITDDEGSSL